MTGKLLGLVVALAMFAPAATWAQTIVDGQTLKARCATIQLANPSGGLACRGYVGAIADVLAEGNPIGEFRACPPAGATREALVKVVKSWLERHPDLLKSKAHILCARALAEEFPCPSGE